jgi:hypothetical protein
VLGGVVHVDHSLADSLEVVRADAAGAEQGCTSGAVQVDGSLDGSVAGAWLGQRGGDKDIPW